MGEKNKQSEMRGEVKVRQREGGGLIDKQMKQRRDQRKMKEKRSQGRDLLLLTK